MSWRPSSFGGASGELRHYLFRKPDTKLLRTMLPATMRWPSAFWLERLHSAGLADVTDAEMHAYDVYRSQVAWDPRFLDRRHDWSFTKWVLREGKLLLIVAVVGIDAYAFILSRHPTYTPLVQAIVVLLFFVGVRDPLIDPNNRDDAEAARIFHRCWCGPCWSPGFCITSCSSGRRSIHPYPQRAVIDPFMDLARSRFSSSTTSIPCSFGERAKSAECSVVLVRAAFEANEPSVSGAVARGPRTIVIGISGLGSATTPEIRGR